MAPARELRHVAALAGVALLWGGAVAAAETPAPAAPSPATLETLLEVTRAREAMKLLAPTFQSQLAQVGYGRFGRHLFRKAFDAAAFVRAAVDGYRRGFRAGPAARVITWYRSELGRKVARLEVRSATAAERSGLKIYLSGFAASKLSGARTGLLRRALRAVQVDRYPQLFSKFSEGFLGGLPPLPDSITGKLEQQLKELSRPSSPPAWLPIYAYTFRDLSDGELRQYVDFLESAQGRWFSALGFSALGSAVSALGARAADALLSLARARQSF